MHQTADLSPTVVLRHPAFDDDHEKSPSSSSDQGVQKLTSQGDGKAAGTTIHSKFLLGYESVKVGNNINMLLVVCGIYRKIRKVGNAGILCGKRDICEK